MRRILMALCIYVAGLATLPIGVELISARSRNVRIESLPDMASPRLVHRPQVVPTTPMMHRAPSPSMKVDRSPAVAVRFVEEESEELFSAPIEVTQAEQGAGVRITIPTEEPQDPFGSKSDFGAEESPFLTPNPQSTPAAPQIVLPVGPETLAGTAPQDEAQIEMLKHLRDDLKKIIEEKSAKMSAAALQTEIEMHRQHLSDLNALEELQKLEQSLKELSDKYPNSDSGRRASELLKVLEQQRRGRRAVPIRSRSGAALSPSSPNPFAHDTQSFQWLRGVVDYDAQNQRWVMVYSADPAETDRYGGSITLNDHQGLGRVQPGDVVLVEGSVDATTLDRHGRPMYRVHRIEPLKRKM